MTKRAYSVMNCTLSQNLWKAGFSASSVKDGHMNRAVAKPKFWGGEKVIFVPTSRAHQKGVGVLQKKEN